MKDHRDTRLLTRSIFGLKQLQDAEFGLVRCEEEEEGWGPKATRGLAFAVFYACPPLLSRFCVEVTEKELYLQDDMAEEYWEAEPGKPQSWEMMDGDEMREGEMMMTAAPPRWLREEEPLSHLTSLKLRDMGEENISEDELRSMLAHCPNLTEIELPCVVPVKDIRRLALDIAHSLCPRLTILEENRSSAERWVCHGLAVRIVDALPEHQVQRLRCLGLSFAIPNLLNSSGNDTRPIFRRHSQTLREVVLWSCWEISSKTIQMILVECLALERLDARSATRTPRRTFNDLMEGIPFRGEFSIDLQDAVEFPWGCTRIKDLRLTISIPDLYDDDDDNGDDDDDDSDNDNQPTSPTTVATAAEDMTATALVQRLESLYRQLGALMELERLYLQAVFYDPGAHCHLPRTYWLSTFPGMLLDTTGDGGPGGGSGGRPAGYLHLLGGLTRLKDLYVSSRSPRKEENNLTIGVEELKWMGKHWPMLEETSPISKRIRSL
ncbi:hypothetical protein BGZ97_013278 [Linnemannia gamsii]|uniref:F-box domain-containing protein n=1 Tax=Linnemannia gamsii TaxID=64522 RepID=A0A9P6UKT4_9FUNG|nr:hypothetical protein BGZ97_013278 [Linnemannia gamsii]